MAAAINDDKLLTEEFGQKFFISNLSSPASFEGIDSIFTAPSPIDQLSKTLNNIVTTGS